MSTPRTFIVAEMACSHEGDPELARRIIDASAAAGADAIQFQIWTLSAMMVPTHPDFAAVQCLELTREQWTSLARYTAATHPRLQIIACVYETASVDFAESVGVDAYKIHAGDLANPTLIRHVAATGKRIDLSVGSSTLDEIAAALSWIRDASTADVWLMYGYQNFPTRVDDAHLDYMMKLKSMFELPVGYQDHTDAEDPAAFWLPAAAVGMHVDVLEKHITHDRSKQGADYQAALNPGEFAQFVHMVRTIEAARGVAVPTPFSADEQRYRRYAKKSIVAARALAAGTTIRESDLLVMRAPTLGLPPVDMPRVLNKRLTRAVEAYEVIGEDHLG